MTPQIVLKIIIAVIIKTDDIDYKSYDNNYVLPIQVPQNHCFTIMNKKVVMFQYFQVNSQFI